jgi:outer membrane protein assembly factor BamB
LLTKEESPTPAPVQKRIEDEFAEFETSDGKNFARFVKSANGEFTLAWCDRWTQGGIQEKGPFYLFRLDREICKGTVERPNDGQVANNGTFIFCDWLFTSDLESVFYAFNSRGEIIIRQKLDANLHNAGLSTDGLFAACQTAVNEDGASSEMLLAFDLNAGKLIWHTKPPFWPEIYEFNSQAMELTIRGTSSIYRSCVLTLVPPPHKKRQRK